MNKKYAKVQSTRRSLIMSIMSLMLCVTMLLGTTYAWFTDSVTSGTNRIVAGNLDVEMYYKNPNHLNWANVQTEDNADPEFFVAANGGDILWEPGVVAVTNFKVKNRGSLALKYDFKTVAIKYNTVKGTNRSLKDVIKFAVIDGTQTFASRDAALAAAAGEFGDFDTFTDSDSLNAGASKEFTVIAYWEPGVLNDDDYNLKNGLTSSDGTPLFVDIEIQLVATQNTAENDSFDNLYDELAELPAWNAEEIDEEEFEEEKVDEEKKKIEIFSAQDLAYFAENAGEYSGYTVKLMNDIDLGGKKWTPMNLWYNDVCYALTIDGNGKTIKNMTIASDNQTIGFISTTASGTYEIKDLTFVNPKIVTNGKGIVGTVIGGMYGNVTLDNVDVTGAEINGCVADQNPTIRLGGLIGQVKLGEGSVTLDMKDCDVTNSTITGFHNVGGMIGTINKSETMLENVKAENCSVKNTTLYYGSTAPQAMNGLAANAISNEGYKAVTFGSVTVENVTILGKIADGVVYDPAEPAYLISNANGLLWFADQVNTGTQTFGRKTVKLDADIDLKDVDWTPIGGKSMGSYPGVTFAGTFDGQNHTVSNLTCVSLEPNYATASFFGSTTGAVKNLKLENVDITSSHYAGGIVAYSSSSGSNVENCHVAGGTITSAPEWLGTEYDNGDKAGGIFGISNEGASITDCSVKDLTIKAYRDIGGIAGRATGTFTNNKVENVTIIQDNTNGYKTDVTTYGIFVGGGTTADETNTSSNVKVLSNKEIVVTLEGGKDATVALAEAMATAADGNTIELPANETFKLPTNMKNVTIKGDGTTKIDAVGNGSIASVTNGATFENMEFDFGGSNYHGFHHAGKITFKNCVLNGLFFSYGDMEFIDCTFNAPDNEYSMWLYGGDATFTGCTFNGTGKWFNVYNEGNGDPYNISFTDCKFVNSGDANKAAINVKDTCQDKKLMYNVTITNCTTEGSFPEAMTGYNGEKLYVIDPLVQVDDIKAGDTNIRVVLDGEPVFPIPAN